jgi:predicted DNA-binding protein YlxM (UPF0122 family)
MERWDTEKNGCTPNYVCYSSNKKYWFKCINCKSHKSESKYITTLTIANNNCDLSCNQCKSVASKRPDLIKYFLNKCDAEKYFPYSHIRVPLICPDCGCIKESSIINLSKNGFSCSKCSDGISYPNKIMFNFLSQIKIKFETEYKPSWSMGKKYDFYFEKNGLLYIIEMDGRFHFEDNNLNGQTKETTVLIDDMKELLAQQHDIKVIRIDCYNSNLIYIKDNIINSKISKLFDLSIVDWQECEKYALKNLVKVVCDLWRQHYNMKEISNQLNIKKSLVRRYLKQGSIINLCDYDPAVEIYKNYHNAHDRNNSQKNKIVCVNTNEVFESILQASKTYGIHITCISNNAKGRQSFAGKLPDGTKFHWMYYEDWLKENPQQELTVT